MEQQTNGQSNDFERVKSVRQNQVLENRIDEQNKKAVSSAVMTVENCMHDEILTAIDRVIIPKIEMAMKSITGSAGRGRSSEVHKSDRRNFLENIRNNPFTSASSRLDLDNELVRNDETRNDVDFKDGDFPALKPNNGWREHAHHTIYL